jgi:uncharacterized protein involved in cysteine biosynthesis
MTNFWAGFSDYFGAGRIILENRLWKWLIAPGILSLLYFPTLFWLGWNFLDDGAGYLRDRWLPGFLQHPAIVWIVTGALAVGLAYLGFVVYRNVIMISYSPVLAYVSERVEAAIHPGRPAARNPASMLDGARRAVLMSVISLGLSLLCLLGCLALLLVPVIGGVLMGVLLPVSQMFLAGHGFVDPTLERKGNDVKRSFQVAWANKLRMIGCGAGFTLLTLIPFAGWFIAPGWGIVAGTRTAVELLEGKAATA